MDGSVVFFRWRQCPDHPSNTCFLGPILEIIIQTVSRLVQPFLQSLRQKVPTFYNGLPLPPQNYLFAWGSGLLSNTWFLWPTRVYNPNGISIGSAVFAGRTILTNRQTDRETTLYSVGNNRPHLYIVLRCGLANDLFT